MKNVCREILLIRMSFAFPFISIFITVYLTAVETASYLRYLRATQAVATLSAPCGVCVNPYRKRFEAAPALSHRCAPNRFPSKIALAKTAYTSCVLSTVKHVEDPAALAPIDWTNKMAVQWPGAVIVTAIGAFIEWVKVLSRKCIYLSVICFRQLPP
jgi:hypothetical protein